MSFQLTKAAQLRSNEVTKEPQLVLEIDGIATVYGTTSLLEYIRIGDADLFIDGSWKIGGLRTLEGQESLLSVGSEAGTTTKITQVLDHEKGRGSSVTTLTMGLIDKDQKITQLITPGNTVTDLMGRRARVYLGFNNTAYKADFIPVFKGIIDDIQAGSGTIKINLGSTEQKKRQEIFQKSQCNLVGAINDSQATITADTTDLFLDGSFKPDGTPETALTRYLKIDDEIMQYTGRTSNTFTGLVRGVLGTVASAHDDDATVESLYRLGPDNGIDLALKVMLGGWQDYFATGVAVTNFVNTTPLTQVDNAIWFSELDVKENYGLTVGDYITTTGASNGANNVTMKVITAIVTSADGSYIVIDDVTFVPELMTSATISFRSQYDTLPTGAALKMLPDDVDVEQHVYLRNLILSNYDLDIFSFDTENGKDFIEEELYVPGAMFSVPRKARSSVNAAIGPVPSFNTVTIDETNTMKPDKIVLKRSLGKNFYNNVVYNYDQEPVEQKYLSSIITVSNDSLVRIPVGVRTLKVQSRGLRTSLNAENIISQTTSRRLNRYRFAAEFFENIQVTYGLGYNIEIGDLVIMDGTSLQISDTVNAERGMAPRLFEVTNKTIDVKAGSITLNLVDSAYSVQSRYALIGPSSVIKIGVSNSEFVLDELPFFKYVATEGDKWSRFKRPSVYVRSEDGSVRETSRILTVNGNTIILETPLTFTPSPGYVMELSSYNTATDQIKLLYGFMQDNATFADGKYQYLMI